MTILDEIVAYKREALVLKKQAMSLEALKKSPNYGRECVSLKTRLQHSNTGIIAEFKRKSPSKGYIHEKAMVSQIVPGYEAAGACGISVLADSLYFGGSVDDVKQARKLVSIPILFKEFVVDEYQIHEAKSAGADVVLLIAAILTPQECFRFAYIAKSLGLEVLLELHKFEEISHINDYVDIVGINNRNLKTFEVNLDASIELAQLIPNGFLKISESGISEPATIKRLRGEGFSGFLMGETFMKTENPAMALTEFIQAVK